MQLLGSCCEDHFFFVGKSVFFIFKEPPKTKPELRIAQSCRSVITELPQGETSSASRYYGLNVYQTSKTVHRAERSKLNA
jgi:hypothetical protein